MLRFKAALLAGTVALVGFTGAAHAGYDTGSFAMTVSTGNTGGSGFAATKGASPFSGPVSTASFTYTGALGFANTAPQNSGTSGDLNSSFFATAGNAAPSYGISLYSGTGTYATLAGFLAASGSASGYQYGSFYTIDLGVLAKGTVLTFTHDDGATVFQDGSQVGTSTAGPTTVITDTVALTKAGDTTLYYSRQNGTPSILQVTVPEPVSIALLGSGMIGLGLARRRRSTAVAA